MPHPGDVTRLLNELSAGRPHAAEDVISLVYHELRRLAAAALRRERCGHTLQPTALVHEAYLRLAGQTRAHWESRSQFFAVAAQVMRRILVDHSRRRHALKRGGLTVAVPLSQVGAAEPPEEILSLDLALDRLVRIDPRQCQIVEMRFFGGLGEEEIGQLLGVSTRTVRRDWRVARAWLRREVAGIQASEQTWGRS